MDASGIRRLGIKSAQIYLDYLSKNGKGIEMVSVHHIIQSDINKYELSVSKKLADVDNIYFDILGNKYTTEQIRIREYDRDRCCLTVCPNDELDKLFCDVSAEQIKIVSDMKFLVRRVKKWYETCPSCLSLQKPTPQVTWDPDAASGAVPSAEQVKAIKTVLSSPLSYVWGAPGTGKTRYVLSNAVLSYITSGKRVIVVAPTNNALEQSLYGLLDVLESAGIGRDKILRLGVPSAKFAKDYPECCEVASIERKIEELREQKAICERQLKLLDFCKSYHVLDNEILPRILQLIERYSLIDEQNKNIQKYSQDISVARILLSGQQENARALASQIEQLDRLFTTARFKAAKFIFPAFASKKKNKMSLLYNALVYHNEQAEKYKGEIQRLNKKIEIAEKIILENNGSSILNEILQLSEISYKIKIIVSSLSAENIDAVHSELDELKRQGEAKLAEFGVTPDDDAFVKLTNRIQQLDAEIEKLNLNSTETRLEYVKVVAVTIDGFISRMDFTNGKEDTGRLKFEVDHIFLDEAGYCCLAKGLAVLARKCPVTFLGDHKQLPPVCELNDDEFETGNAKEAFLWSQSVLAVEDLFSGDFRSAFSNYISCVPFSFEIIAKSDLNTTHRFGASLSKILDEHVYQNGFKSAADVQDFVIDVIHATRRPGDKKRENPAEAEAVKKFVFDEAPGDFAILSPYTNQVKLLGNLLPSARADQRIMTVHASQGREWDTVILSISDTWDKWFTDSKNNATRGLFLLNTAVSRAKRRLVIVCDTNYWSALPEQLIGAIIHSVSASLSP